MVTAETQKTGKIDCAEYAEKNAELLLAKTAAQIEVKMMGLFYGNAFG